MGGWGVIEHFTELINLRLSWVLDHDHQLLFCLFCFQKVADVKAKRVVAASVTASLNSINKDLGPWSIGDQREEKTKNPRLCELLHMKRPLHGGQQPESAGECVSV